MRKSKVPIFTGNNDGVNLEYWISWMENYFAWDGDFTEDQKLQMGWGFIYGEAATWSVADEQVQVWDSWETLKKALSSRFGEVDDPKSYQLCLKEQALIKGNTEVVRNHMLPISMTQLAKETTSEDVTVNGECASLVPQTTTQPLEEETRNDNVIEGKSEALLDGVTIDQVTQIPCHIEDSNLFEMEERDIMPSVVAKYNGNQTARQVFDEMTPRRHKNQKLQRERKIVASKSWMFKYKRAKKTIRKRHNQDGFNTWSRRMCIETSSTEDTNPKSQSAEGPMSQEVETAAPVYKIFDRLPIFKKKSTEKKTTMKKKKKIWKHFITYKRSEEYVKGNRVLLQNVAKMRICHLVGKIVVKVNTKTCVTVKIYTHQVFNKIFIRRTTIKQKKKNTLGGYMVTFATSANRIGLHLLETMGYAGVIISADSGTKESLSTHRSVALQGLFQTSQSKLEEAEEKLKDLETLQVQNLSFETALSVAMDKEIELSENLNAVMEKLKSAAERREKQAIEIDEATTRSIELEALLKHSELRIQKAMEDFTSRDTEGTSLTEKSKDLEKRIRLHEGKLVEASSQSLSLKEKLNQSSAENELLADTNNQLKINIQEIEGYLESEKETANERLHQRDTEAKDLIIKLKSHENLIEKHKRQILEGSGVADTRKVGLEEVLLKLKTLESTIEEFEKENGDLAEVNIKLNQKLATNGSETSYFQAKLPALEAEKDQTVKELNKGKMNKRRKRKQRHKVNVETDPNVALVFISSRSELDDITNVLKAAKSLHQNQFGYEEAYACTSSQLRDLESGETNEWGMKDPLHEADVKGLFGSLFCDFGPHFLVLDVDGEETHSAEGRTQLNDGKARNIHFLKMSDGAATIRFGDCLPDLKRKIKKVEKDKQRVGPSKEDVQTLVATETHIHESLDLVSSVTDFYAYTRLRSQQIEVPEIIPALRNSKCSNTWRFKFKHIIRRKHLNASRRFLFTAPFPHHRVAKELRLVTVVITPLSILYGSLPRPPEVTLSRLGNLLNVKDVEKKELGDKLIFKRGEYCYDPRGSLLK